MTKLKTENFYEILSPRCTVLISTQDKEGRPNAAPFSFVAPVSSNPPLVLFAAAPQRHTLANVRETHEFIREAGDHILVVGRVVNAECKDEFLRIISSLVS